MKHFDLKHKLQLFPSLASLGWLSISRLKYETHAYKIKRATAETGTQYGGAAKNVIRDRAISVSVVVSLSVARYWIPLGGGVEGERW